MKYKVEINYLNIDNYPMIEKHFENMAKKGWKIDKIFAGTLFIYEKSKSKDLEFSISPYEVETVYTRKTKADLKEFQNVSESVGWNYVTKSYDLHIYFKEKGSEAVPIHTDEEEEFKTLEIIAKKYLKAQYISLPILIFLAWFNIGNILNNIYPMKNGLIQIAALFLPFAILGSVIHISELRQFLNKNKENINLGKSLEFNNSKDFIYQVLFSAMYIIFVVLIIYIIYSALVLKNEIILLAFLPILVGVIIGSLYNIFVKPSKKGVRFKKGLFVITLIVAVLLTIPVSIFSYKVVIKNNGSPDIEGLRVLSFNDFIDKDIETEGRLLKDVSIIVPQSYEYSSYMEGHGYIITEYANVINERQAKGLVKRYINQAKNALIGRYARDVEISFKDDLYDSSLIFSGFTEEEFNSLRYKEIKEAKKLAFQIIEKKSITDGSSLWNLDEVYFLSFEKDEIVLRKDKEVFYLQGVDFSDPKIIEITKSKLELD